MRVRAGFVLGVVALAAACAESTTSPVDAGGRLVAFMSSATGDFEIYLLDPSAETIDLLTANPGFDGFPDFHPDGSSIVFVSDRDGEQDIYRMSRDGTGVTRLTDASGDDSTPAYSPDGSSIVFTSERDEDPEVYIMNADGSGQRRLTASPGLDVTPVFSPDGDAIYWVSERAGFQQILRMAVDGSNQELVLGAGELLSRPGFNPATGRLVYSQASSATGALSYVLWEAEADGSGAGPLAGFTLQGVHTTVSSGGEAVAYSAALNTPDEDLFLFDIRTGALDRITNSAGRDLWPTFDPTSGS